MLAGASRQLVGRDILLPVQVGEKALKLFPALLADVHRRDVRPASGACSPGGTETAGPRISAVFFDPAAARSRRGPGRRMLPVPG